MKKSLKGRLAIVTGASGGIGLEFCKTLAERGMSLMMISIDDAPLRKAAALIAEVYGVETHCLTLDLCRDDAADRIFGYLENMSLDPVMLINNAGIFSFAPATDIADKKVKTFIDLHVHAATTLSIRFASYFRQRGCGYILNMSSMSCWMPMPGLSMYAATKAYIRVFSRSLHYEMRDYGVKVMVACPGGIATDLFGLPDNLKRLALRLGAITRPEVFARRSVRRLLRGRRQYVNGLTNRLAILFVGTLPTWARMMVKHRLLDRGIIRP
ncbi:SDR family oxidoreductase [uncultured Duncaniella sp.]|uniref:SDR family NAD(P)-dependent oxidoreductase n=1 Tax=uncultured Duncaniella sp. TaxID=2768039 RepID=UPI00272BA9EB|nr:SDR family NAD(P)-dependent oxidoreductase [uncultured Duncaniella sp.]